MIARTWFVVVIVLITGGLRAQPPVSGVRSFRHFADMIDDADPVRLMAFHLPPAAGLNAQPVDTSMDFRIWFKMVSPPLAESDSLQVPAPKVTEIWLDWTSQGAPPSDKAQPREEVVRLTLNECPHLVDTISSQLTQHTAFPDSVYIRPPFDLSQFIGQCIQLGRNPRSREDKFVVGLVLCDDANQMVVNTDLIVLARYKNSFSLLTKVRYRMLPLQYCEPDGVQFPADLFSRLRNSLSDSEWNVNIVGQEGFQLFNVNTGRAQLFHKFRLRSETVEVSESTSYCGWIARCKDFELLSIARQNPSLLAGLAICSPSAWRLEFRLPVDPELLYIGGEW